MRPVTLAAPPVFLCHSGGGVVHMLDAYWWSFITMTTVGYGDVIPHTHQGRVIGICCAVFGVIIIGNREIVYWWLLYTVNTINFIKQTVDNNWMIDCKSYLGLPIPIITKSFNKFYGVIKKSDSVLLQPSPSQAASPRERSILSQWWRKRWTSSHRLSFFVSFSV